MPQTTVAYRQNKWLAEGQYASTAHRRVDGAIQYAKNGSVILPFGRVAELNPTTNIITPLDGTITAGNLLVIPVFTEKFGIKLDDLAANNSEGVGYPAHYESVEYVTSGDVVMYSEEAVNVGDSVFYRHTAATAPNDVVGRVRKSAVATQTPADALTTAQFAEQTAGAGLVAIRVQAMIGL